MCLSWVLNILPDDQGYSWTSLECVISPINKIVVKSTLKSISLVCWGSGFSQLWLLQSIKGERVVCTYSNLPVIRLAVKWKFFSPLIQVPFISLSFLQRKKKMSYTAIQTIAWMCITYLVIRSVQKRSVWNVTLEQWTQHLPGRVHTHRHHHSQGDPFVQIPFFYGCC